MEDKIYNIVVHYCDSNEECEQLTSELLVLWNSSLQLKDKEETDFNDWLKIETIETDKNDIWVNGVALNDNETIFDVYREMKQPFMFANGQYMVL